MSKLDMLIQCTTHIGGGVFACPGGVAEDEFNLSATPSRNGRYLRARDAASRLNGASLLNRDSTPRPSGLGVLAVGTHDSADGTNALSQMGRKK
jgi:hypothetical protein